MRESGRLAPVTAPRLGEPKRPTSSRQAKALDSGPGVCPDLASHNRGGVSNDGRPAS
jgi:hypothetical protein